MAEENKKNDEAKKPSLKQENERLRKQVEELTATVERLQLEVAAAELVAGVTTEEAEVNTGFVSAPEAYMAAEGYVVVSGELHRVEARFTAKELLDQVRKRFVEEDRTILVIDRHGD